MRYKYLTLLVGAILFINNLPIFAKKNLDDPENLKRSAEGLSSSLNNSISATESELEAIRKQVAMKMTELCGLQTSINDLLLEITKVDKRKRPELIAKLTELREKQNKLAANNKAIDEGMREANDKAQQAMEQATASLVIGVIAGNIQSASSVISFIEQDDRAGLVNLLKRDAQTAPVEIVEISKLNGIILKIRIGRLHHCLSTGKQCNGRAYSVSK